MIMEKHWESTHGERVDLRYSINQAAVNAGSPPQYA